MQFPLECPKEVCSDVSEIILSNFIRGLEIPSITRGGMISEHVKNHTIRGGTSKICHIPQSVVFNGKTNGGKQK